MRRHNPLAWRSRAFRPRGQVVRVWSHFSMRKALLVLTLLLALLVSAVLIRTVRFTSKQVLVPPASRAAVNAQQAAERLSKAIQFQTVSHQNPGQSKDEEFPALHAYLRRTFPRVHSTLNTEVVSNDSLLYTWQGREEGLKPILLMAHLDVVPVESGTEDDWSYPPFSGRIAEGHIWGRGAMDDKVSVLGILEAVEILLGEGFQPRRTVYLAFGHDEEAGGQQGAAQMAAILRARGVRLEYVLDEGLVITHRILPGVSAPVALVGIAEKGYMSVELTVESEGGHSSMPPPQTAVGILSAAIHRLETHPMPARIQGATRQLFEYVGPEMPFVQQIAFANLWLFGRLVKGQLAASPATNALIRTTTAPTMFEGSDKENVLPLKARAVVNFRILPGDSSRSVTEHVRKTINDPRVKIKVFEDGLSEPSRTSSVTSPGFQTLQRTIRQVFSEAVVAPSLVVPATDSRHYAPLSQDVYRFLPLRAASEDLRRFHGTNERVSVENYAECVEFYVQLIRNTNE